MRCCHELSNGAAGSGASCAVEQNGAAGIYSSVCLVLLLLTAEKAYLVDGAQVSALHRCTAFLDQKQCHIPLPSIKCMVQRALLIL